MPPVKSHNYLGADELDKSRAVFFAIPLYSSAIAEIIKHFAVVSTFFLCHQLITILVCDNFLFVLRLQKHLHPVQSVRLIKKINKSLF